MNVEEYRSSIRNKKNNSNKKIKKKGLTLINKLLLTILIFLIGLIASKDNIKVKELISKYIYTPTFDFTEAKKLYNKYIGKYIGEEETTKEVFSEKISYTNQNVYKDGVKLTVSNNYLIPAIESGIVIFIGEKEEYGTTLIISGINGVDMWYSNINVKDVKMYDFVKKGALIGESKDDTIYMVFQKDGKFLDYKEYI